MSDFEIRETVEVLTDDRTKVDFTGRVLGYSDAMRLGGEYLIADDVAGHRIWVASGRVRKIADEVERDFEREWSERNEVIEFDVRTYEELGLDVDEVVGREFDR